MDAVRFLIDFILHIDVHLVEIVRQAGGWTYGVLGLIVFCETGLVVLPILPGDSLLFAAGALAAKPDGVLNVHLLAAILVAAAIAGDALNYAIGDRFGRTIAARGWVKAAHLERTQHFFERYGGRAIVLARFVPIVRTVAPFVAGMGTMPYRQFFVYNVAGGVAWVLLFLYGGYFFGGLRAVEENFSLVILGVIAVSVLPILVEVIRARLRPAVPEDVEDAQAALAAARAAEAADESVR
ncbi:MAG TPA: DedA family protein [Rubricoccaceae bacterium]|jgi:membrane-associated protein